MSKSVLPKSVCRLQMAYRQLDSWFLQSVVFEIISSLIIFTPYLTMDAAPQHHHHVIERRAVVSIQTRHNVHHSYTLPNSSGLITFLVFSFNGKW